MIFKVHFQINVFLMVLIQGCQTYIYIYIYIIKLIQYFSDETVTKHILNFLNGRCKVFQFDRCVQREQTTT